MNETKFKLLVVAAQRRAGGYARRIEDQYAVGIPDLIIGVPDRGLMMVEAKVFTGSTFGPTPRQFVELCRIEDGGGTAALLGFNKRDHVCHLVPINRDTQGKWNVAEQRWISGSIEDTPVMFKEYTER